MSIQTAPAADDDSLPFVVIIATMTEATPRKCDFERSSIWTRFGMGNGFVNRAFGNATSTPALQGGLAFFAQGS